MERNCWCLAARKEQSQQWELEKQQMLAEDCLEVGFVESLLPVSFE